MQHLTQPILLPFVTQGLQSISTLLRASASPLWKGSRLEHLEITSDGREPPANPSTFLKPLTSSSKCKGKSGAVGKKASAAAKEGINNSSSSSSSAIISPAVGANGQGVGNSNSSGPLTAAAASMEASQRAQAKAGSGGVAGGLPAAAASTGLRGAGGGAAAAASLPARPSTAPGASGVGNLNPQCAFYGANQADVICLKAGWADSS